MISNNKLKRRHTDLRRRALLKYGLSIPAFGFAGCAEENNEQVSAGKNFLAPEQTVCSVIPYIYTYPHYRENSLQRNDIRENKTGAFLHLNFKVVDLNRKCLPVAYADVDIWHADVNGDYSDYDHGTGLATDGDRSFRGHQVTTPFGKVEFMTDIPGWSVDVVDGSLQSRVSHINLKVHLNNKTKLTTEVYFPDELLEHVYDLKPYKGREQKTITHQGKNKVFNRPKGLAEDPVWKKNKPENTLLQIGLIPQGYRANLVLAISV